MLLLFLFRDFVLLRSWGKRDNCYFICCTSVEHPKCPPIPNYVRAEQVISACIFRPLPGCSNQCNLVWFLCNDLKLALPQRLLDRALNSLLPSMMTGLIERSQLIANTPLDDFFIDIQPHRTSRKKKRAKRSSKKHHVRSQTVIKTLDSVKENVTHSSDDSDAAADGDNLLPRNHRLL
ncbi:Steroidogenic acute regulatory protein mitochondrial [Schistosoma japonicum]|nr:Steroidogenic acute regulatory protein mitochondrial [Schistosoma japonicum]